MKKLYAVVLFISFLYSTNSYAQLEDITPRYGLLSFTGMANNFTTKNDNSRSSAIGLFSPSFPVANACLNIKDKAYIGFMGGAELGVSFPKADGMAILGHINMGFTAAYQFNDDFFWGFSHYLRVQTTSFHQGRSDDGWVIGTTIRYKNLMLDLTKNLGPNKKNNNVILAGRMGFPFTEIFPKYIFNIKDNTFWVGIRYERFKGKNTDPTDFNVDTNLDILIGKYLSF